MGIPRNVDIDGITKSIVYSQYLKLSFPKFYESINGFEVPDNTNPHINEHYHSNSNNIINNNNNEEVKQNHHAGRRTEKRREHSTYNEIKRTKSNLHQRKHQHQNNNQEVIDPYFYATSEGIEIIDVDANEIEAELYQKDQKASIGFWNSRGKFQFY